MKLATFRDGTKDGALMVVDRSLRVMRSAAGIAPTMQAALDSWEAACPRLEELSARLESGDLDGTVPFDPKLLMAPIPRSFAWLDGTSYLSHMQRARELRGATLPPGFDTEPLMTERIGIFLGPCDPLPLYDPSVQMDIEAEIGVILGEVPVAATLSQAAASIKLLTLVNDISFRRILAETLARGRSATLLAKNWPSMAPVAVTPDELGDAWDGDFVRLALRSSINGALLASPNGAIDGSFTFPDLIANCAQYKPLPPGTVLAAGTVSNYDDAVGGGCIVERRCIEMRRSGVASTPFLAVGDRVTIEMMDHAGRSIFGAIDQTVRAGGSA